MELKQISTSCFTVEIERHPKVPHLIVLRVWDKGYKDILKSLSIQHDLRGNVWISHSEQLIEIKKSD